jgi:hypothetical protein
VRFVGKKILCFGDRLLGVVLRLGNFSLYRFLALLAIFSLNFFQAGCAWAFVHHHNSLDKQSKGTTKKHGQIVQETESASISPGRHHRRHGHAIVMWSASKRTLVHLIAHHRGRHRHGHEVAQKPRERHAYPVGIFLASPPTFDQSAFPADLSASIRSAFTQGLGDSYPARSLVKAGIVTYHPLRGGIYWRREAIKYVIVHSTETGRPLTAIQVIESWSSMGRRHPGAQYVIERDGAIYQALDPDLASVHVNVFKTLPGINNDNSVGIEMCHTGSQDYPDVQVASLIKLVTYLQGHYHVPDENVITHRYAQQGDHTDPVNFGWDRFIADKGRLQQSAAALKVAMLNNEAVNWQTAILPLPEAFLELHRPIRLVPQAVAVPPVAASPLAVPAQDGSDSYIKLKAEALPVSAGMTSLVIQPKSDAVVPAPAVPQKRIPLLAPLRGPIELDPAAVKMLAPNPPPSKLGQMHSDASPNASGGAPLPTGRP